MQNRKEVLVKTRIAPSPTGDIHIGQMRTVLYNYAFAKQKNGVFLLRIEDTDRARYVQGAEERIMDTIIDYGLSWDEGERVGGPFAPYTQSKRLEIYRKYALELVEKGAAYYCFCSKERLEELRKNGYERKLASIKYDKHCLSLSRWEVEEKLKNQAPCVIRLNVLPNRKISFKDEVLGEISFSSNDIDDQVLLKSDGFPTYHLAVVVDDHLMKVTHVLRGIDWLPSTPKHILLYEAFGWEPPVFAHLPNLKEVGESRKMSKRRKSAFARDFLEEGYLPEALLNFLMFLGWNPGTNKEIYTLEEFIRDFSLDRVQKTDLVSFDREKLLWMNGYYIRNMSNEDLYKKICEWSKKWGKDIKMCGANYNTAIKIVSLIKDRIKTLNEVKDFTDYFFERPMLNLELIRQYSLDNWQNILYDFLDLFSKVDENNWNSSYLDNICHELLSKKPYKTKEAFMTLRVALSAQVATPPIFDVLEIMGKPEVIDRLKISINIR